MGIKKNIYANVDLNQLEKEISSAIQYLETLDVENLYDDILWEAKPKPFLISSIEKKITTALRIIQSTATIALAMFEKEGISPFLEHMSFSVINCLKEIQHYYSNRPISNIQHRFVEGTTYDRKGLPKMTRILANSAEDQTVARIVITEKILVILPLIEKLEEIKKVATLKGDKELPESLMYD